MKKTARDLLAEARKSVGEVTPEEVKALREKGEKFALLDVREPEEFRAGYIEGAQHASRGFLELRVEQLVPDRETSIVAYCAGGIRSLLAGKALREMGYRNVVSMSGGFNGWKDRGYPWVKDEPLSPEQLQRYSRHYMLSEVGEGGQKRLLRSRVLLIGAGGLGSPAALYLAAVGVGTLGVVDSDRVDITNLQRQVLHKTSSIGKPKVESARETLEALNPDVRVVTYDTRLTAENIMEIISGYDLVVDGCDNFETRYIVNDACVLAGKPNVHGSIFQFEGQATVLHPPRGPCYRCLFPSPPPPGLVPS